MMPVAVKIEPSSDHPDMLDTHSEYRESRLTKRSLMLINVIAIVGQKLTYASRVTLLPPQQPLNPSSTPQSIMINTHS
jgi:hypothetical protein